jgi:hypothetical protein
MNTFKITKNTEGQIHRTALTDGINFLWGKIILLCFFFVVVGLFGTAAMKAYCTLTP